MDGHAGGGGQEHCPRRSPAPPSGLSGSSAPPPVRGLCRQQVASRLRGFQASRQWVLGSCPGSELSAVWEGRGIGPPGPCPLGTAPGGTLLTGERLTPLPPRAQTPGLATLCETTACRCWAAPQCPAGAPGVLRAGCWDGAAPRVLASFFSLKWIVGGGAPQSQGWAGIFGGPLCSVRCPIGPCRNRTPPAPLRSGRTLSPCLTPTPWPTGHAGGGERGSPGSPRPLPAEIGTLGQKRWTLPCGGKRTGRHGRGKRA